jgi:hypothetical protein
MANQDYWNDYDEEQPPLDCGCPFTGHCGLCGKCMDHCDHKDYRAALEKMRRNRNQAHNAVRSIDVALARLEKIKRDLLETTGTVIQEDDKTIYIPPGAKLMDDE